MLGHDQGAVKVYVCDNFTSLIDSTGVMSHFQVTESCLQTANFWRVAVGNFPRHNVS